jgi:glycosyltransferase involved in cell wall biosynthesis
MAPYCIDNAFFSEQAEVLKPERATIRAEWGLPDDAVVFLFVGKFEEKKRPKFLIDAFRSVASPAYLLMVGSGDLLEECQEAVQADNLPVRFTGFMNQGQIPRAYAAADVLLLPSDYGETWGLVVNEAMACGLPAVVSNHVGSHPDLIEAGKTGYTYPMDDVAALRERIDALTHDPTHIQTMGAQAVEKISNFTFDHVLSGVMEALAYCVGENGGRAS